MVLEFSHRFLKVVNLPIRVNSVTFITSLTLVSIRTHTAVTLVSKTALTFGVVLARIPDTSTLTKAVIEITILNNHWMSFFCHIQNSQGRGRGYQTKPKTEVHNPYQGKMFLLLYRQQAKLSKAPELDMTTRRNHAPRSYMTDYPWPWVSLSWLLYNLQLFDVLVNDFENSMYALGQSEKI